MAQGPGPPFTRSCKKVCENKTKKRDHQQHDQVVPQLERRFGDNGAMVSSPAPVNCDPVLNVMTTGCMRSLEAPSSTSTGPSRPEPLNQEGLSQYGMHLGGDAPETVDRDGHVLGCGRDRPAPTVLSDDSCRGTRARAPHDRRTHRRAG